MRGVFHKYIFPNLLVFPMVSHWILPSGIEQQLYLWLFGVCFYLPNLCYLWYIGAYKSQKRISVILHPGIKKWILIFCFVLLGYVLVGAMVNNIRGLGLILIDNLTFIYFPILFLLYPLDERQIERTKYLMVGALLILIAEVILFSLGIMHYTTDAGNTLEGQDYVGVMRISTTVGAATGTGLILLVLGVLSTSVYTMPKKYKIALLILTTIAILFTISRGATISWLLYCAYYFYHYYFKHKKLRHKVYAALSVVVVLLALNNMGVFDPMYERSQQLGGLEDATGRNERMQKGLSIYEKSGKVGVGSGQVFPEKSIESKIKSPYLMAPHNVYIILLAEYGWLGTLLILSMLLMIFAHFDYRKPSSVFVWVFLAINFNTEGCILAAEFFSLLMFLCMVSIKRRPIGRCVTSNFAIV